MNSIIAMNPEAPLVLIVVGLLAVWLWYLERNRTGARRLLRIVCYTALVLALLLLMLPLHYPAELAPATARLHTPTIPPEAFKEPQGHASQYDFAMPGAMQGRAILDIPDPGYIPRHYPDVRELEIIGAGLWPWELSPLGEIALKPDLSPTQPGIRFLHWPQELTLGSACIVSGTLLSPGSGSQLSLSDAAGVCDSLEFDSPGLHTFSLTAAIKDTGRFSLRLRLEDVDRLVIDQGNIPLSIISPPTLRIIILEGSVSFQIGIFKRWAANNGHALAVRSGLTAGQWREEFLNTSRFQLAPLTRSVLDTSDVLIIDAGLLRKLSGVEMRNIMTAVASGLGILIRGDERDIELPGNRSANSLQFQLDALPASAAEMIIPSWADWPTDPLSELPVARRRIKSGLLLQPLIVDADHAMLAAARPHHQGRIALSLLTETFRWQLQGKPALYSAYWSYLLSSVARSKLSTARWRWVQENPILPDMPLTIFCSTVAQSPSGIILSPSGQADTLALRQSATVPGDWIGTYWPRRDGWHHITSHSGSSSAFYVFPDSAWAQWQAHQKREATYRAAQIWSGDVASSTLHQTWVPLSPIWWYLLLLISLSALWIESTA